jgi:hypothetical protein
MPQKRSRQDNHNTKKIKKKQKKNLNKTNTSDNSSKIDSELDFTMETKNYEEESKNTTNEFLNSTNKDCYQNQKKKLIDDINGFDSLESPSNLDLMKALVGVMKFQLSTITEIEQVNQKLNETNMKVAENTQEIVSIQH